MKIKICENYEQMSREAANVFSEELKRNPECVLGLATGDTPIGMYHCLVDDYKAANNSYSSSYDDYDDYY